MSFVLLLAACASHSPEPQVAKEPTAAKSSIDVERDAIAWQDVEDEGADNSSAGTPALASSILERAFELIGTPYRFGGTTAKGFDCSGFVGYLFREEAGIKLPRSTRELIDMDVPLVSRTSCSPATCCSSTTVAVAASATPASTSAMASSSIPPVVAAAGCGWTAWTPATGA